MSTADMNAVESFPLGIARLAVRGLSASSRASSRRFAAIATVRAVTMHATISPICPNFGQPLAARNVANNAHGIANSVCEILMSAAKVESRLASGKEVEGAVVMPSHLPNAKVTPALAYP